MDNEKKMQKPIRPLCLEIEEAKADIINAINNAVRTRKIPYFQLESIVNDAARLVTECAAAEREAAQNLYTRQLAEYQAENAKLSKE